LDAYVTEDIIADTFKVYCPVESVRVIKNKTTGESRGFAFITFQSIELAQQVLNTLNGRIDVISQGRTIRGDLEFAFSHPRPESTPQPTRTDWNCPKCGGHNFSRRTQCYQCKLDKPADATALPQINGQYWDPNQAAQNYWQDPNSAAYAAGYDPAQYAAAYGMEASQYAAYYEQYNPQQATESTTAPATQAPQPSTGADLDDEFSSFLEQVGSSDTKTSTQPQQWPQGMNFVWDDSKGCYLDAQSGYCYEAMSGLYFKRQENDKIDYYTYDTATNTFAPYKEQQVVVNPAPAPVAKTVISAQPVKVISSQPVISAPPVIERPPEEKPASTASAAKPTLVSISFSKSNPNDFDKWNQKKQELRAAFEEEDAQAEEKSNSDQNSASDPAGEQDPEDDVSGEAEEEEGPITVGTICMLCQRELETDAKLQKHLTKSELHKKNLEAKEEQRRQKQQDRLARKLYKQQLQNMKNAKKRKKNWNQNKKNKKQKTELNPLTSGPPTAGLGFGGAPVSATPATPALDDDSPAARMMRKMGWRGGGLGAKESGMENPVQVTMRTERTGLGSESEVPVSEDLTVLPTDTYQQATRKRMLARYNNLS
jgi:hypothetical protein